METEIVAPTVEPRGGRRAAQTRQIPLEQVAGSFRCHEYVAQPSKRFVAPKHGREPQEHESKRSPLTRSGNEFRIAGDLPEPALYIGTVEDAKKIAEEGLERLLLLDNRMTAVRQGELVARGRARRRSALPIVVPNPRSKGWA